MNPVPREDRQGTSQETPSGETVPASARHTVQPVDDALDPPKRRLHLHLDLDADDLQELCSALSTIANDLLYEGQEQAEQHSGGWSTGHHLKLTLTDETMDGDTFRRLIAEWSKARKEAASGDASGGRAVRSGGT